MKSNLSTLLFLAGLTASHGQNTWTNGDGNFLWNATSSNWSDPAIWENGGHAVFGPDDEEEGFIGPIVVDAGIEAGSLTFNAGGYSLSGGPLTLTGPDVVTGAGANTTISAVLAGSAGLTKNGPGWLTLTGGNTYSGTTTVAGGVLFASNASGPSLPGNVTLGTGGGSDLFLITTANNQFAPGSVLAFNNGTSNTKFELRGTSQTVYGLSSPDSNTLSIIQNSENGSPGSTSNGAGVLTVDIDTDNVFHGLIRNSHNGTLGLVKEGSGTLTLVGVAVQASSYTGGTTVNSGAVHFGNGNNQNAHGGGPIHIAGGASVKFHYNALGIPSNISGEGTLEIQRNNRSDNLAAGDNVINTGFGTFSGQLVATDMRLRANSTTTSTPFGDVSTITTSGNGQVMFHPTGGRTYDYDFIIDGMGYYETNGNRYGALRLENGSVVAGSVTLAGNAGIGAQDGGAGGVISGVISDGGNNYGFTKLGVNTITLTAANTYTGATVVQTGTLALSGSGSIAASTTIEVQAGAFLNVAAVNGGWTLAATQTLKGNGTVTGDFTVEGILATGSSAGTLNAAGSVTLASGSVWEVELGGTALGEYDQLLAAGDLDAGGTIALLLINGFAPSYGDNFQIAGFDNFINSDYSFDIAGAPLSPELRWDFSDFANSGVITVIPESSTVLLAGLGALGLLRRRR